jgi:hypothetical protein
VVATEPVAVNTFRFPRRLTLLKQSSLQKRSDYLWSPILPFTGRGTVAFDDHDARFAKVREGLNKTFAVASPLHGLGVESANAAWVC